MDMSEVGAEFISMEHVQHVELHKRKERFVYEATYFADQPANSPELHQRPLYAEGAEGSGADRFHIAPSLSRTWYEGMHHLPQVLLVLENV